MDSNKLDLRGEICPFTLVRTKKEFKKILSGDKLLVMVDYPASVDEISTWVKEAGHKIIEIKKSGVLLWEMLLEKGKDG
ncbi:MAG TPA: sulfurtransferase TusA family protein [Nitrospiria bacterium]|nr:sulfurtransferase TusA family protein [Nitrospiria bacterium]